MFICGFCCNVHTGLVLFEIATFSGKKREYKVRNNKADENVIMPKNCILHTHTTTTTKTKNNNNSNNNNKKKKKKKKKKKSHEIKTTS